MAILGDKQSPATSTSQDLTHIQRVEYLRRVDCCRAVMISLDRLIVDRETQAQTVKSDKELGSARWPWVVGGIGALMYWLGDVFGFREVRGIGIAGVGLCVWIYATSAFKSWTASSRLQTINSAIAHLRFHWLAVAGPYDAFEKYCGLVRESEGQPDWNVYSELQNNVRTEILEHLVANS